MENENTTPTEEKDKKTVGDGVPDVPAETATETPSDIAAQKQKTCIKRYRFMARIERFELSRRFPDLLP